MSLKSFFKKAERALRPLGGVIKGAVGALPGGQGLLMARQALISTKRISQGVTPRSAVLPGRGAEGMAAQLGGMSASLTSPFARQTLALTGALRSPSQLAMRGVPQMSILPALVRGAGTIARRLPGAVTTAAAATVLYDAMGNQVTTRRRRRKGISASELKAFTRVTQVLAKYCKTPPPTKRRGAPRGKSCR
jgi:hypothetical protein